MTRWCADDCDPPCWDVHETVDYGLVGRTSLPRPVQLFHELGEHEWFHPYKMVDQVAETQVGNWKIEKYTVDQMSAIVENLKEVDPGRWIVAGNYCRLVHDSTKQTWMSDTPSEIQDHLEFMDRAYGRVLITGLGLGLAPAFVGRKCCVEKVTVVEIDPEVAVLFTKGWLANQPAEVQAKFEIVIGDAFELGAFWRADMSHRFEMAWHDIWPTINPDDYYQQSKLMRLFGPMVRDTQLAWKRPWYEGYLAWQRAGGEKADQQLRPKT